MSTCNSKIVVMGGSFNPPTIAHLRLMQAAMDGVGAGSGIFVPVSHAYLKRKMRKAEDARICLSERMRLEMLETFCREDERISVSEAEYGTATVRVRDTLLSLLARNPDAEVYFVIGADKVGMFARWNASGDFDGRFHLMAFDRDDGVDGVPSPLVGNVALLRPPPGVAHISSTAARRAFLSGSGLDGLLTSAVTEILTRLDPAGCVPEIWRFDGEHAFLGNRFPSPIAMDGLEFGNAEAAFWAASCADERGRQAVADARTKNARCVAERQARRPDWEDARLSAMEEVVRAKFRQNEELARKLDATGDARLVWTNSVPDTYWGEDRYVCAGENHLGEILMKVRRELRYSDRIQTSRRDYSEQGRCRFRRETTGEEHEIAV